MEKRPKRSNTITPMETTPQITPELLARITEQLLAQQAQQTTTIIHEFGAYKLKAFPPNSPQSFNTKVPVLPSQQTLIDYAWNAKNKAQMTVTLQALAVYFHNNNTASAASTNQAVSEKSLYPDIPNMKLLATIKELEYENAMLKEKLQQLEGIEKECQQLKNYIEEEERNRIFDWGAWKQFPHKLYPARENILGRVLADHLGEQLHYQQKFRRLAVQSQTFQGLTFKAETYKSNEITCRGFSYLTCSINLQEWKLLSSNFSLDHLFKLGLVHKLIITTKAQVGLINKEKLAAVLWELFDETPGSIYEVEFQTIPPSYYPNHLDNARSYITIREARSGVQIYKLIAQEDLVSEDEVDILDQINMYRAMVYRKPFLIEPQYDLVAEESDDKIYTYHPVQTSFSGLTTDFAQEVLYFSRMRTYNMTTLLGNLSHSLYVDRSASSESSISAPYNDDNIVDDVTEHNLNNLLEL